MKSKRFYWFLFGLALLLAYLQKTPCLSGSWGRPEMVQYSKLCYNDIQALFTPRGLDKRKIPYVEESKFEYPPLIGYQMYLTALLSESHLEFFKVNALVNSIWALLAFIFLISCFGYTPSLLLFFTLPSFIIYLHLNWDISSVFCICAAIWAWSRKRWTLCALFLGIGFTGKMFPLFFVPSLLISLYQQGIGWKKKVSEFLLGLFTGLCLFNFPTFMLDLLLNQKIDALLTTFRFHAVRTPDFGTPWYWIGHYWEWGPTSMEFTKTVDRIFLGAMALYSSLILWNQWKNNRSPWCSGAAITAFCLVISKVHSPQYALWFLGFYVALGTPWYLLLPYALFDLMLLYSGFHWFVASPEMGPHPYRSLFIASIFLRNGSLLLLSLYWGFLGKERPTRQET